MVFKKVMDWVQAWVKHQIINCLKCKQQQAYSHKGHAAYKAIY